MQFLLSSIIFAAAVCALPQHRVYRRQNTTAGAAGNRLIPVVVGGQQDVFIPNVVTASVGDVIQFQFSNGNHTATQSAQDGACSPLAGGIHSGHVPFVDGQTTVGTFNMPILNTDPIFMYCATGPHCQSGQVLVINPADDLQVANYAKLSAAAAENIDGTVVIGGTVAEIPLESAAFTPAPVEEEQGPPADAAPVEEAAPAESVVAEVPVEAAPATSSAVPAATVVAEGLAARAD